MRKSDTLSMNAQGRGRPREFYLDKALDAAMEVFWRKGFMQSTLNDLCAAMGIKPPSFYCAFGARDNLSHETLRHCGCFVSVSATGLGASEKRIEEMLSSVEAKSIENFLKRLMRAIDDGQISPDNDVPAISGAIMAFLKGVASLSRTEICRAELTAIAACGLLLLPPALKSHHTGR